MKLFLFLDSLIRKISQSDTKLKIVSNNPAKSVTGKKNGYIVFLLILANKLHGFKSF